MTGITRPLKQTDFKQNLNLNLLKGSGISKKAAKGQDKEALKKACLGVEAVFLNIMLKEMRKTIPKGGIFPDSIQKDIYTSLFDQQLCQEATKTKSAIGLSDLLFEYLTR